MTAAYNGYFMPESVEHTRCPYNPWSNPITPVFPRYQSKRVHNMSAAKTDLFPAGGSGKVMLTWHTNIDLLRKATQHSIALPQVTLDTKATLTQQHATNKGMLQAVPGAVFHVRFPVPSNDCVRSCFSKHVVILGCLCSSCVGTHSQHHHGCHATPYHSMPNYCSTPHFNTTPHRFTTKTHHHIPPHHQRCRHTGQLFYCQRNNTMQPHQCTPHTHKNSSVMMPNFPPACTQQMLCV